MRNKDQNKMDYETAMLILKDYSDVLSGCKTQFKPVSLLSNSIEEIKSAIIANIIVCKIREIKNIPFSKDDKELYELMEFSFTSLADFVEDIKVKRLNDYLDFMENLENFPYPKKPSEEEKVENWKRLSFHPGHKDYAEYLQVFINLRMNLQN